MSHRRARIARHNNVPGHGVLIVAVDERHFSDSGGVNARRESDEKSRGLVIKKQVNDFIFRFQFLGSFLILIFRV